MDDELHYIKSRAQMKLIEDPAFHRFVGMILRDTSETILPA